MSDWRAEFERERYTVPSPPPDTSGGPTIGYEQWVRRRSCLSKRRYTRQYDARAHVLRLWRQGKSAHEYRCEFGDHWHVTSRVEEE